MPKHLIKVRARVVQEVDYLVEVDGVPGRDDAGTLAIGAIDCNPPFLRPNRKSPVAIEAMRWDLVPEANPDDVDLCVTVKGDVAFILEP